MKKYFAFAAALALATACSSSSGDSSGGVLPPATVSLSGKVSDPAVEGARLALYDADGAVVSLCGANMNTICQAWSASDGTFSMTVSSSADLSGYHIKSVGGTDTAYGTKFSSFSFAAPMAFFSAGPDGSYSGVNVTPLTSLVKALMDSGRTATDAAEALSSALGLSQADISADPESGGAILKQAFLVVKTAMATGGNDPIGKIAEAVARNRGGFSSDAVLGEIFGSDAASIAEIKAAAQALEPMSAEDTRGLVESISSYELTNMFLKAYAPLLEMEASALSENAKSNIGFLAGSLKAFAGAAIPLNEFTINQIAGYIASYNPSLGEYATFDRDSPAFQADLNTLFASAQEELKGILDKMIREDVYITSIPLSEPLGGDNQKRLEYYFNSDADRNYKARSLTSGVLNNSIVDSIYLEIIRSYSNFGLLQKAENLAEVYIKGSLNRVAAYSLLSSGAAHYDKAAAKGYADRAYETLTAMERAGYTVDEKFIQRYVSVAGNYAKAGYPDDFNAVRTHLFNDIIGSLTEDTTPKKSTIYGSVLSAMGSYARNNTSNDPLINSQILSGEYELAVSSLQMFKEFTDTYPEASNRLTAQAMYYASAVNYYADIAQADSSYRTAAAAAAGEIMNSLAEIDKYLQDHATGNVKYFCWSTSVYGMMGNSVYTLLGYDAAMNILNTINPALYTSGTGSRQRYLADMMKFLAADRGFNEAVALYETYSKVNSTYSNVVGGRNLTYVFVGTLLNSAGGLARYAVETGNNALAKSALDYAYGKLKEAITYHTENNKTEGQLISSTVSDAGFSAKYWREGITAVAYWYYRAGYSAEAGEALRFGAAYPAVMADSLQKQAAYAAIAYYANMFGFRDIFADCYEKSRQVTALPANATSAQKASLYIFRAYDSTVMNVSDRDASVKADLLEAARYADEIHSDGETDDKKANSEMAYFTYIAERYNAISDTENRDASLLKAEEALSKIVAANTRKSAALTLLKTYASMDMVDEAYKKSQTLLTLAADRYEGIEAIVSSLVEGLDNSDIAVSDFDRDGKPDFFAPWATQADINRFGYVLDDDIDGDGKPDTEDLTPFYRD